jgi:hypothetical protein
MLPTRNGRGKPSGVKELVSEAQLVQIDRFFTVENVVYVDFEAPRLRAYWSRQVAAVLDLARFRRSDNAELCAMPRTDAEMPEA